MGKITGITYPKAKEAEMFPCPYCDKEYKTQDGLEKHIADKHPETLEEPPKED